MVQKGIKETVFELRNVDDLIPSGNDDDLIPSGNDVADAFDNVSDYAKEITRYGELTHERTRLTNEISAMNVKMVELMQKIKDEELEFDNKQYEFIRSLSIWFK